MPRTPNETTQSQFRLRPETLADLDAIRDHLRDLDGRAASRADAVRVSARAYAATLQKKTKKKTTNPPDSA